LRNNHKASTKIEQIIARLSEKVAVMAYPLILANGEIVGVLLLCKFHAGSLPENFFEQSGCLETIDWLAPHLATSFDNAKWLNKTKLLKQYHENERRISTITGQFYSEAIPDRNLKLIEAMCNECMKILNSGNSQHPFYQNFLFYEYQEYRKLFVLRSYGRRPTIVWSSFHVKSRHYKELVQDGQVKCVESQARFVQNRGKYPYIVRYLFENKIEDITLRLTPIGHQRWLARLSLCRFLKTRIRLAF
jgi:hypothetical protein